jgi:RNA polymerase sigma-70 factor (ECF subfamily)
VTGTTDTDDGALVAAAQDGDRTALDRLLRRHYDRIHGLCRRLTNNDADALDATQEALLAIVRGLARFDGRAAFSTWAYRIATNACIDEHRRRARRPTPVDPADPTAELSAAPLTDDAPGDDQLVADRLAIDEALHELSPEFRAAVVLRDVVGLDYAEIADVLAVPPGTVRSRIARGRAALARRLGNPTADANVGTDAP